MTVRFTINEVDINDHENSRNGQLLDIFLNNRELMLCINCFLVTRFIGGYGIFKGGVQPLIHSFVHHSVPKLELINGKNDGKMFRSYILQHHRPQPSP